MRDDLMVQQQVDNSWQHMVGVICLTQTGRKQVKVCFHPIWYLFQRTLSNTTSDTIKS